MARPIPLNQESRFDVEELFFSKTDHRGIILSGNPVFIRVSQFGKEQLFGAPHNIIRHPDMPKAVFKLLWDTIQGGKPIGAYVKNMARDGSYYWVFAAVWPCDGGYVSLRIKPTSPILNKVKEVYAAALMKERTGTVDASLASIVAALAELGFESYDSFMSTALVAELQARDNTIRAKASNRELGDEGLERIYQRTGQAALEYADLFKALTLFIEGAQTIRTSSARTLALFKELAFISVNMAVDAERAGESGRAVAEVSNGFNKIADEIRQGITGFQQSQDRLLKAISGSQFGIGGARLQIEMIRGVLEEGVDQASRGELLETLKGLLTLAAVSSRSVAANLHEMQSTLRIFTSRSNELRSTISGLDVVRLSGKIEISKLPEQSSQAFSNHIARMDDFIRNVSKAMSDINLAGTTLLGSLDDSVRKLKKVIDLLD